MNSNLNIKEEMKLTSSLHRPKTLSKRALLLLTPFLLLQSTMAVITVHFVEEESDVRVSFSGSIDLSGTAFSFSDPSPFGPASSFTSNFSILAGGSGNRIGSVGSNEVTSLRFQLIPASASAEIFGFNGSALFFSDRHNTSSNDGVPTILTVDPDLDTFLVNQTLSELNATAGDITEGAVLWTSNGPIGDTFIFSRLAPVPVPEPSTTALGGIVLLGLLRRRRR